MSTEVYNKEDYQLSEEQLTKLNYLNNNINRIQKDIEETEQNISLIHQQYDSYLTRCNQYLQQIQNGKTVNVTELLKEDLFSFTKNNRSSTNRKQHIDLDIATYQYNMERCTEQLKSFEHDHQLFTQTMYCIEGCRLYLWKSRPELETVVSIKLYIFRNNIPHYCSIYSALPPDMKECFINIKEDAEITRELYLQVDKQICNILVKRYYTCSILYFIVRSLLRTEMLMKEEDELELYIGENMIENANIPIDVLQTDTKEITLKIIPREKKKRYFRCTVTNLKQLKNVPDKVNSIIFDLSNIIVIC